MRTPCNSTIRLRFRSWLEFEWAMLPRPGAVDTKTELYENCCIRSLTSLILGIVFSGVVRLLLDSVSHTHYHRQPKGLFCHKRGFELQRVRLSRSKFESGDQQKFEPSGTVLGCCLQPCTLKITGLGCLSSCRTWQLVWQLDRQHQSERCNNREPYAVM